MNKLISIIAQMQTPKKDREIIHRGWCTREEYDQLKVPPIYKLSKDDFLDKLFEWLMYALLLIAIYLIITGVE